MAMLNNQMVNWPMQNMFFNLLSTRDAEVLPMRAVVGGYATKTT